MAEEPAPEVDPLVSLKEADRRRGGCGAFLIGAAVMGFIFAFLVALQTIAGDRISSQLQAEFGGYFMLGAFILSVAGGIIAANAFTRLRVARMDRLAAEKKAGPPST